MSKICNSAFTDAKYGNDKTGELNNPDKKFSTINRAIEEINKKNPSSCNRWVVFLDPCTFEEDVDLYPFIDIHGKDRIVSVIKGTINANNLSSFSDQVELKEFSLIGQIIKSSKSLGLLSLFEVTVTTSNKNLATNKECPSPFDIEAGQVKCDSCIIRQDVSAKTKRDVTFYKLHGSSFIDLNIRNCRHERNTALKTYRGQTFSNITHSNNNEKTLISFQSNLFFNAFVSKFNGLLIPYNTDNAAGFFQSHSDTLRHDFRNGAGNGVKSPTEGQTFDSAFILVKKVAAPHKNLETHIHTTEVLNLPETTLTTLSSVHTVNSGKAKTKHVAFQGFREIPEALRILDNGDMIVSTSRNAERSMTGAASDNKLFASRLVLETLIINAGNFPPVPPGNPQGPTLTLPDNVGVVDVEESAVIIIPIPPNITIGQQITFNFISGTFFAITGRPDPDNPPPVPVVIIIRDSRGSPSSGNFIVYSLLDLSPPRNLYPNTPFILVKNTVSTTLTVTSITQLPGGPLTVTFTSTSVPGESRVLQPGITTTSVPAGTKSVQVTLWAAGGAGGPFNDFGFPGIYSAAGGGGAGGTTILYTADATNLQSITSIVAPPTTAIGANGGATILSFNYTTKVDTFTAFGGGGGGAATQFVGVGFNPAPGGTGQGSAFVFNNQSINPPPNFVVVNGTLGGNAGTAVPGGAPSKGFDGQSHPISGEPGGIGGSTFFLSGGAPTIVSGAGGGGAGYPAQGGSGANFTVDTTGNTSLTGVAGPPAGPGGGGAGQGPLNVTGLTNGGQGGALITFF